MTTILHKPFTTEWRGKPPHMLKPDVPVWYRFLERNASLFHSLYYDCLLGAPDLDQEEEKDPLKRMWRFNISKRADAIATTDNHVWIIEVADDPGLRALGQLQVYRSLWLQDPVIDKMERLDLVCETIDPHLTAACIQHGINVHVV